MLLSIIIPAFNEAAILGHTLDRIEQALKAQETADLTWELIICDNNSTDQTAQIAKGKGAQVVFEPINQISRARNRGASVANGEWFLFIDADSYPTPELMADTVASIKDNKYVGCGTTVLVKGGALFNKLRMERLNPLFILFNWSGAAFLLCQAEAFRALEGFSTILYAYEEIDFVIRLKRYGRRQGLTFTVLYHHPVITSGRKGEYNVISLLRLFISNFAALILFILSYILPAKLTRWLSSKLLGYWYNR